mgnify:CR=1 FL=1
MKLCSGSVTLICEYPRICYCLNIADKDLSYVRMLASPALYNVGADYMEGDAALVQKRGEFASRIAPPIFR